MAKQRTVRMRTQFTIGQYAETWWWEVWIGERWLIVNDLEFIGTLSCMADGNDWAHAANLKPEWE